MKFTHRVAGDVVIVSLSGKVMGGEGTAMCRERLLDYLKSNSRKFVMDMGDVVWTNSQGLGMLIGCYVSVRRAGGNLVLARIANVKDILVMTHLVQVFDCYGSVDEAVRSFGADTDRHE